jgi:hypothetical protein
MHRSRGILLFILGATLLTISACTKSQSPDPTSTNPTGKNIASNTNIYVTSCDGDGSVKRIDKKSHWQVPNTAQLRLYACLKDKPTKQPLKGTRFQIEDESNPGVYYYPECKDAAGHVHSGPDCTSDDNGCIRWTEWMPYNYYTEQSARLEVVRKLFAPGTGSSATISYYVDPWAMDGHGKRDDVKSVECEKTTGGRPEDLIAASEQRKQADILSGDKNAAQIWMDDVDVDIISRQKYGEGELYELALAGHPQVKWKDNFGKESYHPMDDGEFEVFAHLVNLDTGPDQKANMILTAGEMSTWAFLENKVFHTTLRTSLERRTSIGNVALVLRLVPRNYGGSTPLKEFFGIFELNSIKDFAEGHKTGPLARYCWAKDRDPVKCNWDNFLGTADNWQRFQALGIAYKNKPLLFSTLRLRFVTIAAYPAETATRRTVTYSASTCVSDRKGNRLTHVPFVVEYVDDNGNSERAGGADSDDEMAQREAAYSLQKLETDDEGCLRWLAHIQHDYYKQEEFVGKHIKIQMLNQDAVVIDPDPYALHPTPEQKKPIKKTPAGETLTFLLNPWDDKFTFGFDKREVSDTFLEETLLRPKPESRFFTGGYGYHTISFRYDIDKYMNLEVKKTILLEVDPRVLRYSGIVNARRTAENLRDGIYLLKVGLQKSFLDPATPGVQIYPRPGQKDRLGIKNTLNPNKQESCNADSNNVPCREYVSTKTTLVRVVDGRLIKPIELTMHDLRLMRIRSNFMIELELVDEHALNVDKTLQEEFRRLSAINLDEVKKYRSQYSCTDDLKCEEEFKTTKKTSFDPLLMKQRYKMRQAETIAKLESAFKVYAELLKTDMADSPNRQELVKRDSELAKKLDAALQTNDFTRLPLPDCDLDRDHCDRFLEKNAEGKLDDLKTKPWLKARTFVGPVIFLSNGYSDAVRPTDNLDEVCRADNRFLDDEQRATYGLYDPSKLFYNAPANKDNDDAPPEDQLFMPTADKEYPKTFGALPEGTKIVFNSQRENKDYRYFPYFGRLTQFCGRQVDFFIKREKELRQEYLDTMETDSRIENFVSMYNMDFAILNQNNNREYLSNKNRIEFGDVVEKMNENSSVQVPAESAYDLLTRFDRLKATDQQIEPICHLLVNHAIARLSDLVRDDSSGDSRAGWQAIVEFYKSNLGANFPIDHPPGFKQDLIKNCMHYARDLSPEAASIIVDQKLRIFETGTDYMFKGGLQINLNVGNSMSVSRSNSKGASTEFVDYLDTMVGVGVGYMIGGPVGAALGGIAVKPFSIKPSTSIGDSEGTSISAQTYLVGQIAKFDVELRQYESCRVLRLSPSVLNQAWYISWFANVDPKLRNKAGATLENLISRGIMVCDGAITNRSIKVPEDYFYFTQHFTEGDMLDQADLLNHPWLMSLRGDRDFGAFSRLMNLQEDVSWNRFYKGAVGYEVRKPDWPLEKLANVFKATTPTFPGIYSVMSTDEDSITGFPIEKRLIVIDKDINAEKCSIPERCSNDEFHGFRTEKQFYDGGGRAMESPNNN